MNAWQVSDVPDRPHGQLRFASPIYPADNPQREIPAYAWPVDVRIRFVSIWLGSDAGSPFPLVDTWATLFASNPSGYALCSACFDRYAAPNAPHTRDRILNFPAKAGDMIGGSFGAVALSAPSHVQVLVIVEYDKQEAR